MTKQCGLFSGCATTPLPAAPKNKNPSPEGFDNVIKEGDFVRLVALATKQGLSPAHIDALLASQYWYVRVTTIRNQKLSLEQLNALAMDTHYRVREMAKEEKEWLAKRATDLDVIE